MLGDLIFDVIFEVFFHPLWRALYWVYGRLKGFTIGVLARLASLVPGRSVDDSS